MGLFDFETAETKVRNRTPLVKSIAQKLDADYQYSIRGVKDKFNIEDSSECENSNVIVGEKNGFEYCFIEYYHVGRGKNDHSKWVSKVSLRLNDTFPDFDLQTRSSALSGVGCMAVLSLPFLGIPFFLLSQLLMFCFAFFHSKSGFQLEMLIPMGAFILFGSIFGFIGWSIFSSALKTYKQINNQGQYYIRNPKFKEKYVILSDADVYRVRKVFNDNVCSKIVKFTPEITEISCRNNCLKKDFGSNEQLSYPLCHNYLIPLVKQAELLEDYDSESLF